MKLQLSCLTLICAAPFFASWEAPAAPGPTTPSGATAGRATYHVDAGHSSVVFRTTHEGIANFYGRFNALEGEIQYDPQSPGSGSVVIEIDASSVDTNSEGRDKHLRSPDFLSVKEFPEIAFRSTGVKADGDRMAVSGDLTLHGVTKQVSAEFDVTGMKETQRGFKAGFEARFTIDMRDYGLSFVQANPTALGPEVHLIVSVECVRQ